MNYVYQLETWSRASLFRDQLPAMLCSSRTKGNSQCRLIGGYQGGHSSACSVALLELLKRVERSAHGICIALAGHLFQALVQRTVPVGVEESRLSVIAILVCQGSSVAVLFKLSRSSHVELCFAILLSSLAL